MGSRLVVDVKDTNDFSYVRLSGIIDEDNDLADITKRISKSTVVIDTADVDRINSCGVRDWVTWLGDMDKQGADIFLVECSPAIMTQINLVNNFVGTGTIISFYAPYFCPACDTDKMLLVQVEEALQTTPYRPAVCRCDQCDHTMEFDDIESSYFAFLSTVEKAKLDGTTMEEIKQFSADSEGKLRTRTPSLPQVVTSSSVPTPTTPSSKDLKGLLSESVSFTPPQYSAAEPTSNTNKILYFIIGLLIVAIVLLGYVVIRSAQ